ncbi:Glucose/ribitol dehydrogenase [Cynara cardunculus var. scolymus]|uniref:Glucose/ribitol dehydrogenase n=1 Tax=Cynara cardunculus var. scolymus TaxID=59895 RepID=A0A124SCJ0_CYNCS|nr:Glucose/ribitol dehydrogenase [Cynara cardunculus var. scolymus]
MAAVAQFHMFPANPHHKTTQSPVTQLGFCRSSVLWEPIPPFSGRKVCLQPCRSFRSEEGKNGGGKEKGNTRRNVLGAIKSLILSNDNSMEKLEEKLSRIYCDDDEHRSDFVNWIQFIGNIDVKSLNEGGDGQMNDLIWYSWVGGIIIGTMIGSNMVLDEVSRAGPRNVVITGSTRGLGKALAREFLLSGDRVVIASRSEKSVDMTIKELEENLQEGMATAMSSSRKNLVNAKVVGTSCDVCDPEDVRNLADFAVNELGSIDIWINNAGTNKGFRPLLQFTDEDIKQNKQMFNIICELPETVARTLVPRMRVVKGSGKAINYLTPPRILLALVTAWLRRGRWFDDKGRALYAAEADRLRNWAESRARFSFTDAMEMYTENTWVSVFSLSVVCAFIILSSTTGNASGHIDNFHLL